MLPNFGIIGYINRIKIQTFNFAKLTEPKFPDPMLYIKKVTYETN